MKVLITILVCNQVVYDDLYRAVVQSVIAGKTTYQQKTQTLETLRALCRGQRSSYEMGVVRK